MHQPGWWINKAVQKWQSHLPKKLRWKTSKTFNTAHLKDESYEAWRNACRGWFRLVDAKCNFFIELNQPKSLIYICSMRLAIGRNYAIQKLNTRPFQQSVRLSAVNCLIHEMWPKYGEISCKRAVRRRVNEYVYTMIASKFFCLARLW